MAEIKIKKKTPIWPWILLIAVLLAVIYFVFFANKVDNVTHEDNTEKVTDDNKMHKNNAVNEGTMLLSAAAISKISAYQTYIAKDADMGLDHGYSHTALNKLIDATESVASSLGVDVKADLETARANADAITKDPDKVNHADKIKDAGSTIVKAMKKIQTKKFPDLDGSWVKLQESVKAIAPGTQTLEQKTAIKNFFDRASELLVNMKNK